MANPQIPNDPYRAPDAYRPTGDDLRGPAQVDNDLQPDLELAEGPASGSRIAMFTIAIALVLGAVFYGLNNSSVNEASTAPATPATTAQNSAQPSPPAPPPGMRDVTPHANTDAGVTTGAAPAKPQTPPSSAPTGQDINRTGNPPMNNGTQNK